jgi:hypothetical protein
MEQHALNCLFNDGFGLSSSGLFEHVRLSDVRQTLEETPRRSRPPSNVSRLFANSLHSALARSIVQVSFAFPHRFREHGVCDGGSYARARSADGHFLSCRCGVIG